MVRGNVRLLERQLGYEVEPTLSKNHKYLKRIQQALDSVKDEYRDCTPKHLQNNASFRRRCEEIFDRYGPRVWDGAHEAISGVSYNVDYPRVLFYGSASDRKKLYDLFFQLVLEKCRISRQNQLDKMSRDRRAAAAAATARGPALLPTNENDENDKNPRHCARPGNDAASETRIQTHDAVAATVRQPEDSVTVSPGNNGSPEISEMEFTQHDIGAQSDAEDQEYFPSGASGTPNKNHDAGPTATSANAPRRLTRKGLGGAYLKGNAFTSDRNAEDVDKPHEKETEDVSDFEVAQVSGRPEGRSLSPFHAGNTIKRKAGRQSNSSLTKRPRNTYAKRRERPDVAAAVPVDVDYKAHDATIRTDEDASTAEAATFKFPTGFTLDRRSSTRDVMSPSQVTGAEESSQAHDNAHGSFGPFAGHDNGDATKNAADEAIDRDSGAEDQENDNNTAFARRDVPHEPLEEGDQISTTAGCHTQSRRSSLMHDVEHGTQFDGRETGHDQPVVSPTNLVSPVGATEDVPYSPRVDTTFSIDGPTPMSKGKEPVRRPASTEDRVNRGESSKTQRPVASSSFTAGASPTTSALRDYCKLLIVQWIPDDSSATHICRLTRYVPDLWNYLRARQPAAFEGQPVLWVKTGKVTMSAADVLNRYGERIEPDALHDCLQVLMDKAYGPGASTVTSWDKVTVRIGMQ